MENLPENLLFRGRLGGKDVDIEPELCPSPLDTLIGSPPVLVGDETHLTGILDEIWEHTAFGNLLSSQRIIPPPRSRYSLISCDVSEAFSELRAARNPVTGAREGYEEVFTEDDGPEDAEVDGLEDYEDSECDDDEDKEDEEDDLLAPYSSGAVTLGMKQSKLNGCPEQALVDMPSEDLETPEEAPIDAQEPSEEVLNISTAVDARTVRLEWAEQIDISKPVANFQQKVPDPAFKWTFQLDAFQQHAIVKLEEDQSVFIAAHTSAGKTVVAEYAIALTRRNKTRAIYTSPLKALSNEKYRDFKETFSDIGLITGDVQINTEASCLIMTTEILRSMLYNQSDALTNLEWVIFDECHYINDSRRGVVWEEALIMLPRNVGLILLSATVPDALGLADWIGRIKQRRVYVISTMKRPVPLEHYIYYHYEAYLLLDTNNRFQTASYGRACAAEKAAPAGARSFEDPARYERLIRQLQRDHLLPVICFTFSRRRCNSNAKLLANLNLLTDDEKWAVDSFLDKKVRPQFKGMDKNLDQLCFTTELLKKGFGVHHSGMLPVLKEAIEILFKQGLVKVLFATETFSVGVNMPARTVVFDHFMKHDGTSQRVLLPAEYIQMAGRAGRRGKDETGTVLILGKGFVPESTVLQTMMLGRPTELQSQFRITYSMILNLKAQPNMRVEDMIRCSFRENSIQKQKRSIAERCASLEAELSSLARVECTLCQDLSLQLLEEEDAARAAAWEQVLSYPVVTRCLSLGRLLLVRSPEGLNLLGAFASLSTREKRLLLWVLASDKPQTNERKTPLPWPLSKKIAVPSGASTVQQMTFMFSSVLCIYAKSIKIDPKHMSMAQNRKAVALDLLWIVEADPTGPPVINVLKDLRVTALDTVYSVKRSQELEKKLLESKSLTCPLFELHFEQEYQHWKLSEEVQKLRHQLSEESLASMPDFHQHVLVLKKLGFMTEDGVLTLKGRVARALSSHEVMLAELLVEDAVHDLGPAEVAGLFACFVYEQRTDDEQEVYVNLKKAKEKVKEVALKIGKMQRECGFAEPEEQFLEQFSFGLCNTVYEWALGECFYKVMRITSEQEGIVVRCIQRLDELLNDLQTAANIIGNMELKAKMDSASRLIHRDIVFTTSLYHQ